MTEKRFCKDCKHHRGIGYDFWCGEGHTEYEVFCGETNCPYYEFHDWSKGVLDKTENKRFTLAYEKGKWWAVRDWDITLWKEEVIHLLNELYKENEELKTKVDFYKYFQKDARELEKENEHLKSVVKEVIELLSEEVDVFSDKATEHDINAYIELNELDNKDAYYMATATKKAIRMLKGVVDD